MATVIQVVGWTGLVGAVPGTVFVVKMALLILRALRQIELLVAIAADAGEGLISKLEPLSRLPAAEQSTQALAEQSAALGSSAATLERALEVLAGRRAGAA